MHTVTLNDPIIPLGAGDGRAEPDLLVGGLFVEHVSADGGDGDVQDAGLVLLDSFIDRQMWVVAYAILSLDIGTLLLSLLQVLDKVVEVVLRVLVVLLRGQGCRLRDMRCGSSNRGLGVRGLGVF